MLAFLNLNHAKEKKKDVVSIALGRQHLCKNWGG